MKIDRTPKITREFPLQSRKGEPVDMTGNEFRKDVKVAVVTLITV